MTSVSVLVQLNRPRPDGAVVIGTSFIEGMRNAHRRMWLGKRLTVKLDDISFSGEWSGTLGCEEEEEGRVYVLCVYA